MASVAQYCQRLRQCVDAQDVSTLTKMLSLNISIRSIQGALAEPEQSLVQCSRYLPNPWDQVAINFLKSMGALLRKDHAESSKYHIVLLQNLSRCVPSDSNWPMTAVEVVADNLRIIALQADKKQAGSIVCQEEASRSLQNCFKDCINDRSPPDSSKKSSALSFTISLLKLYFSMNNYNLCRNIVQGIEGPMFPSLQNFDRKLVCTYNYYVGRFDMFTGKINEADRRLTDAFNNTNPACVRIRRDILRYLIPARMQVGQLPSRALLNTYKLTQYAPLVSAIKSGCITDFRNAILVNQSEYIRDGVYLLLDRLQTLVYRSLLYKIHKVTQKVQIKLPLVLTCFKQSSAQDMSPEGVECVLANLIHLGYVKGYIAHKQQVLVLSKKCAFPQLSDVPLSTFA